MTKPDDISIVTAFFDIGRGGWKVWNGYARYMARTTKTYLKRFGYLATLNNHMTVFTSADLKERVLYLRKGKEDRTVVITTELQSLYPHYRKEIDRIQNLKAFREMLKYRKHPEDRNVDYVMVNMLKSFFVSQAIINDATPGHLVAWMDFGYCRKPGDTAGLDVWKYPFDAGKVHLFPIREYTGQPIERIIADNVVYMTGPHIIAGREVWPVLTSLIFNALDKLISANMIHNDQTLLLLAYCEKPQLFELHPITDKDWFCGIRNFHE
jgi:protein YibB